MLSSRERVVRCLTFTGPDRVPRDLWLLLWAEKNQPKATAELRNRYPGDFQTAAYFYPPSSKIKGDPYAAGEYRDEWGCVFHNIQEGIIGEVKNPMVRDLSGWKRVEPPYEQLPPDRNKAYEDIRRFYGETKKFVLANACPRPWERYQFLRGTENALTDILTREKEFEALLQCIHSFYLTELEFWVKADVDGITFMDDWGAQDRLLIPPDIWRELFKPLYKDYCDLARSRDKFVFMHSDGWIEDIYPDLAEVGVNAVNSQLFCMDMENLARTVKGKLTFWGEIDRQHVLPSPDPAEGRRAVREVIRHLYDPSGGVIAQFEFGPGANPETALAIFDEWEKTHDPTVCR